MNDFIINEVNRLKKKYKTNNPFEIALGEKIIILYEPLGTIKGYYNKYARQKFIHINSNLTEREQLITCGHELGHSRLHPNANTPFFRENTLYSINKLEMEANKFNAHLLIDINELDEFNSENYSIQQLANLYNVPIELMNIRFNLY